MNTAEQLTASFIAVVLTGRYSLDTLCEHSFMSAGFGSADQKLADENKANLLVICAATAGWAL